MSIYDYSVPKPKGEELKLADFKGKVMLIVNTATGCGFTPQYEDLEKMYEKYHDKGLEIIDIPCNQFGHQTPGTDDEVHQFCQLHYKTQFPQMKKSDVNGVNELPLYTYLKEQKGFAGFGKHKFASLLADMLSKVNPNWAENPDIKWNFTKFLINKNGEVTERFEPTADMAEIETKITELL
ncbi:MAG: glutathione peroxidase [Alphaproteobacteria bacterium]|nr:glutathione peroxidase [Alphaproteobacteria bacterium]